jgi:hypothetical protein
VALVGGAVVHFEAGAKFRLIRSVFELRSDKGGKTAFLVMTWREGYVSTGRAATCPGLRYSNRWVVDSKVNPGNRWFGLQDGDEKADLKITHRVSVLERSTLIAPVCVETTGTWSGTGAA